MRQFGIRDLLWLVLLVAICLAWWLDHRRLTYAAGQAISVVIDQRGREDQTRFTLERYENEVRSLRKFIEYNGLKVPDWGGPQTILVQPTTAPAETPMGQDMGPNFGGVKPKIIPQPAEPLLR